MIEILRLESCCVDCSKIVFVEIVEQAEGGGGFSWCVSLKIERCRRLPLGDPACITLPIRESRDLEEAPRGIIDVVTLMHGCELP